MALVCGLLTHNMDGREVASTEPKETENPDAGTRGMGEEAVASVAPTGTPPASPGKIAREMPDEPLPGQKRPPCKYRGAKVVKGGCWLMPVEAERPPCESSDYEYEGRCYFPLLTRAERAPISEEP